MLYRCRTCRRIVASSANAIPVEKGAGTFRNKRSSHAQRGTSSFLLHEYSDLHSKKQPHKVFVLTVRWTLTQVRNMQYRFCSKAGRS